MNGEEWKEQRKFSLRVMRDLGMGTQAFEDKMLEEIEDAMLRLEAGKGKPVNVYPIIGSSVANGITIMITGRHLKLEHPIRQLIEESFVERGDDARPSMFNLLFYSPFLMKAVLLLPFGPRKSFFEGTRKLLEYLQEEANAHKSIEVTSETPRSFMEAYVREMRSEKPSGKYFDDLHLLGNATAIYGGGANTTGDLLTWIFLLMTIDPEIQRKIRQEIDEVIGASRVSVKHRDSMPFTEATILEAHRFANSIPSGLWHAVAEDVELEGYLLPKGTQVIFSSYAVHMDPEYFDQPHEFKPERFIKDGRFVRDERVMSFGIGKRSCPGEPIANMEIFLYVCSILQRFEVEMPKGKRYRTDGVTDFLGRIPSDSPINLLFKRR